MMAVSDLGWQIDHPASARASRVGPHVTSADNPRRITFRTRDIADLMAGAMWLIHTGNAGTLPDVPIVLWHGLRDPKAAFGSPNSDHKGGVASDHNWLDHPWEVATGVAAYDRHMNDPKHHDAHRVFEAVEARLTAPGHRPAVRWGGRPWATDAGWTAYRRGYRDCMHWVIGTTDPVRIRAAADHLRTWFAPPHSEAHVKTYQRRLGIADDGQWGPGSVAAMRTEQRRLGVPATGLPGDVATLAAWAREDADPRKSFDPAVLAQVEQSLDALGYAGVDVWAKTRAYQQDHGLDPADGLPRAPTREHLEDTMTTLPEQIAAAVWAHRIGKEDAAARSWLRGGNLKAGRAQSASQEAAATIVGQDAAIKALTEALATQQQINPQQLEDAVNRAMTNALAGLKADVTLTIEEA
jgi:peptidoglycan hydrolase-like protein with peptidoglycan-binding domain